MLETMTAEGSIFSLSENFSHLADTERTLFTARVGGGIPSRLYIFLDKDYNDAET